MNRLDRISQREALEKRVHYAHFYVAQGELQLLDMKTKTTIYLRGDTPRPFEIKSGWCNKD